MVARHVVAQVQHQVPQVVLFLRADGAVGQAHVVPTPHETADGVVGVDPRVHPRRRAELGARRTKFDGVDGRGTGEGLDEGGHATC